MTERQIKKKFFAIWFLKKTIIFVTFNVKFKIKYGTGFIGRIT